MPKADGTIVIDTKIQDGGFKAGTKELETSARNMASSVSNASKQTKAALKDEANAVIQANREFAKQQAHVDSLKAKMAQLAAQRLPTEAYAAAEKSVASLEKKLDTAIERQIKFVETGGKQKSRTFEAMEYDIARLTEQLEEARKEKEALESSGKAYMSGADTAQGQELGSQLVTEQSKLETMGIKVLELYSSMEAKVALLSKASKSVFGTMASGLRAVAASAAKAATHLARMAASGIAAGLKKISAGMFGLNKSANNNVLTFKNLLKYGLGIRSVYALVNKLRRGLVEGVNNMAQFDSSTRSALNSISASMSQLGNAAASAAGPIIQALAPALNYIISLAIAAANAIAQLLAALGGKGVFVKATKQAKGLGAAVGGAGSAAKEAKKELASFDKLNVKKDDDAGGGGGGGGGAGAGGGFETAEIDSRIKGIADKIKDLIKAQDWEGLGAYLASGVNYGLEKLYDIINWDNVGPKITPFITAFTETFNSLVDHIDWDLMGRVLGAGINTLVNTLDLLITGIDWENLGKKFGEGANGMVKEIDWGKLGKMIGHKLSILPKMLAGFVMTMDWSALGTGIGLGIDNTLRNFDWTAFFTGLFGLAVGLMESLVKALETVNWFEVGKAIADGIEKGAKNADLSRLPGLIAEGVGAVIGGLGALLWGLIKNQWDQAVKYWQEQAFQDGKFTILGLLKGIGEGMMNIGKWIVENIFNPFMKGLRSAFGIESPAKATQEVGMYIIQGLLKGITDFMPELDKPLKDIYDKFEKKWTEIKETTETKWAETKKVLDEKIESLKEKLPTIDDIKETVENAWADISGSTNTTWPNIASTVISAIDSMISKFGEWATSALRAFKDVSEAAKEIRLPHVGGTNDRKDGYTAPGMASGSVVPPRAGEFLAVLGDNNKETEVVSPLSTRRQAMLEALNANGGYGGGGDIEAHIYLDGKELGASMVRFTRNEKKRTGKNPLLA